MSKIEVKGPFVECHVRLITMDGRVDSPNPVLFDATRIVSIISSVEMDGVVIFVDGVDGRDEIACDPKLFVDAVILARLNAAKPSVGETVKQELLALRKFQDDMWALFKEGELTDAEYRQAAHDLTIQTGGIFKAFYEGFPDDDTEA